MDVPNCQQIGPQRLSGSGGSLLGGETKEFGKGPGELILQSIDYVGVAALGTIVVSLLVCVYLLFSMTW